MTVVTLKNGDIMTTKKARSILNNMRTTIVYMIHEDDAPQILQDINDLWDTFKVSMNRKDADRQAKVELEMLRSSTPLEEIL